MKTMCPFKDSVMVCGDNLEVTLFSCLHIYYAHLAIVRFEHSVCRGSIVTNVLFHVIKSSLIKLLLASITVSTKILKKKTLQKHFLA